MNKKIFGTDGIRNLSSDEIFNDHSLSILSRSLLKDKNNLKIVIARDTRESSQKIEKILVKNLVNNGGKVYLAGLIPTPVLSYIVKSLKYDLGIVISASHNQYNYNGLKFFNKKGEKISFKEEKKIEKYFFNPDKNRTIIGKKGNIFKSNKLSNNYVKKLVSIFKNKIKLNNHKIIIDCANGATFKIIKTIYKKLKINCVYINDKPNGKNINLNCGSLFPNNLKKKVLSMSADFGVSFDGDGDRLICCDEVGNIIDGDKILSSLIKFFYKKKKIKCVVGTLMSNKGFEDFVKDLGIKFYRSNVGDRFVYDLIKKKKGFIGGEQSGHIILNNFGPSGDGILIATYLLMILSLSGEKASDIFENYKNYHQYQENIFFKDSNKLKKIKFINFLKNHNNKLINGNRVLVRLSGTEPVIRLLIEGRKFSIINNLAKLLKTRIKKLIK